jgi:hypothetical protein
MNWLKAIKRHLLNRFGFGVYRPGHYYSPIPDQSYIRQNESRIFTLDDPKDIDLNFNFQYDFLRDSLRYYGEFSFPLTRHSGFYYYLENSYFNQTDALGLFMILNHYKPKKIIEVGSGFSSACMFDTYEKFIKLPVDITLIEPYPERLKMLLGNDRNLGYELKETNVQQVESSFFYSLNKDDLLFIDSSHISKAGSDLNYLLFSILPTLKSGVIIHFHDICYPFEYPKEWIYDGVYWNEVYLIRAFLMNNPSYEILLFNHFLGTKHATWLKENMPKFVSGGSIYIRKK